MAAGKTAKTARSAQAARTAKSTGSGSGAGGLARRLAFYLVGLLIMTLGIAISVKSDLGVSPVSSIPYTMTVVWGIEMGLATVIFHVLLVLLQVVLLRRSFKMKNLLQVPVGILFGMLTSFSLWLASFFPDVSGIWAQLALSLASTVFVAFGIFLYVPADIMPLAGEGAMLAVSKVTGVKFSTVKIAFDVSMMAISLVTCLALVHALGSVGVGTVIAAFLVGLELKGITRALGPARDKLLQIGAFAPAAAAQADGTAATPLAGIMQADVYTLSADATYRDALEFLVEKGISGAPVVGEGGKLVGFISDGDILRRLAGEHSLFVTDASLDQVGFNDQLSSALDTRIGDFATKKVITVGLADDLSDVCYVLAENHLKKAPVMSGGKMVGIVNRSNITSYATRLISAR